MWLFILHGPLNYDHDCTQIHQRVCFPQSFFSLFPFCPSFFSAPNQLIQGGEIVSFIFFYYFFLAK